MCCAPIRVCHTSPIPARTLPAPQRLAFQAIREVRRTAIGVIAAHLQWKTLRCPGRASASTSRAMSLTAATSAAPGSPAARSASTTPGSPAKSTSAMLGLRRLGRLRRRQGPPGGTVISAASGSAARRLSAVLEFSGGTVPLHQRPVPRRPPALFDGARASPTVPSTFSRAGSPAAGSPSRAPGSPAARSSSTPRFTGSAGSSTARQFTGGRVDFSGARFSGSTVDFSFAYNWSKPPIFNSEGDEQPRGVKLPKKNDQSQPSARVAVGHVAVGQALPN